MRLRTRLLLALGYLVVLLTVAFAVPLALNLRDRTADELRAEGRNQVAFLAEGAASYVARGDATELTTLAASAGRTARGRVVIVDRRGVVLADSAGPGTRGTAYANTTRPELVSALRGDGVQVQRASDTLGEEILASAAPVYRNRRVVGAVRLTQSVGAVNAATNRTTVAILAVGLAVLLVALLVAFVLARGIARPITRLEAAAQRVAAGDLDARATVEGSDEQRSLAQSFNTMTERVARAIRSQREFAADASHQLRTPLTGLRLRLEEARATTSRGDLEHEIDAGLREVDRIAQTVDELLVLSRTGERDAPGEVVSLTEVVSAAGRRWHATAQAHGLALQTETSAPSQPVWCARADLDRALDAVVENAIFYGAGGSAVTIRADGTAIDVLDEGAGIAPGEEEQIFDRFRRGRAGADGTPGTGLGLAIARDLMRCWDGEAEIVNRQPRGAQATLRLPPFTDSLPTV
jgi:two-component system, OmpR family, sensor kinase